MNRVGRWLVAGLVALAAAATLHGLWWEHFRGDGLFTSRDSALQWSVVVGWIVCGTVLWRRHHASTAVIMLLIAIIPPSFLITFHYQTWGEAAWVTAFYAGWILPAALVVVYPDGPARHARLFVVCYFVVPAALALRAGAAFTKPFLPSTPLNADVDEIHQLEAWVLAFSVVAAAIAVLRWSRLTGPDRAARRPLVLCACAWAAAQCWAVAMARIVNPHGPSDETPTFRVAASMPLVTFTALLASVAWAELIRPRLARTTGRDLALPPGTDPVTGALDEVRRVMRDPTAVLLVADGQSERQLSALEPAAHEGQVTTWLQRDGQPIGAIRHSAAVLTEPDTHVLAAILGAAAVANQHLVSATTAQLEATRAAARRMLTASDDARDALERAVLAGPIEQLDAALRELDSAGDSASLDRVHERLLGALADIRKVAHASPPRGLTSGGLAAAIPDLIAQRGAEIDIHGLTSARYEPPIEATAYLVVDAAISALASTDAPTAVSCTVVPTPSGLALVFEPLVASIPETLVDRITALGGDSRSGDGVWHVQLPSVMPIATLQAASHA